MRFHVEHKIFKTSHPSDLLKTGCFFFFGEFWPCHMACGVLAPQPGIELTTLAVTSWSPNHWTKREFPKLDVSKYFLNASLRIFPDTQC